MQHNVKSRRKLRPVLRWLALIFLSMLLVNGLSVLYLRWFAPPVTAFMLEQRIFKGQIYHYQWMDWPQLGTAAPLAVMAAEDQKFPDHFGFDVASIQDAVSKKIEGQGLRGASTITQQVAKNLFLWPGRSLLRKSIEAWITVLIELSWSKQRILEVYLNIVEFGPGIYGVPEASRIYFGKNPKQLTAAEAALLAAVLPNPNVLRVDKPTDYVRKRQHWIITQSERLKRDGWFHRMD